ncbi:MAG: D-cysteine desulfhydrase family protein [Candidatus Marinimicrobia bacterium]|nr:D-cysteine desulfhydrase family protein [Candidatus Neomarinimicrobiota bacterium]
MNKALLLLPRLELAKLPTPLDRVENLGKSLGDLDLWFKRDDLTGFGLGGNKVRSLEYLAADAMKVNSNILITGGSPGSNHVRTTMAVAAHLGLKGVAVLSGTRPSKANGNLLLNQLLDAKLVFTGNPDRSYIDNYIEDEAERLRGKGESPYMIRRGGVSSLGCIGYVSAAVEICSQLQSLNLNPDILLCATGCGVTQAGLLVGFKLMGLNCRLYGITVSRSRDECIAYIKQLINETEDVLGLESRVKNDEIFVFDEYIGEGYSVPTSEGIDAIRLVAQTEGIFLDPIYTGKAMAGLTDLVKKDLIGSDNTVIFLHTGGSPSIFSNSTIISNSNNLADSVIDKSTSSQLNSMNIN